MVKKNFKNFYANVFSNFYRSVKDSALKEDVRLLTYLLSYWKFCYRMTKRAYLGCKQLISWDDRKFLSLHRVVITSGITVNLG